MEPSISDRVRDARIAADLTQEELAARAGVAVRTVRNLEQGAPCSTTSLRLIADALGLRLELSQ